MCPKGGRIHRSVAVRRCDSVAWAVAIKVLSRPLPLDHLPMAFNADLLKPTLQAKGSLQPLFSANALMVCGFFGGPFAALWLFGMNSRRAGHGNKDVGILVMGGFLALLCLFGLGALHSEGQIERVAFRLSGLLAGWVLVRLLRDEYAARRLNGIDPAGPWWWGAGAVILGIALEMWTRQLMTAVSQAT